MGTRPILNTTFHNFSLGLKYPLALLLVRLTFRPDTLSKQIDHWAETILRWFTCVLHETILSVFFQFIFKGFNLSVEFGEAWPGSTQPHFRPPCIQSRCFSNLLSAYAFVLPNILLLDGIH